MTARGVDFTGIAYLAAMGFAAAIAWQVYRKSGGAVASVTNAAKSVVSAVNPADQNNLVNRGANTVFKAVSGNNVDSIGTWLYGVINPDKAAYVPQIATWTTADQEDMEAGLFAQGIPVLTAADYEDADAGFYKMTDTAGGASLAYRIKK